jgi:hypothetical protein
MGDLLTLQKPDDDNQERGLLKMSNDKRADDLERASIDASTQGLKALLLLNGGACIALLAFISSVVGTKVAGREAAFVSSARQALVYFAIGAGLSVVTCVFAYLANQAYSSHLRNAAHYPKHWTYGHLWTRAGLVTTVISLGLFFFGIYTIWLRAY